MASVSLSSFLLLYFASIVDAPLSTTSDSTHDGLRDSTRVIGTPVRSLFLLVSNTLEQTLTHALFIRWSWNPVDPQVLRQRRHTGVAESEAFRNTSIATLNWPKCCRIPCSVVLHRLVNVWRISCVLACCYFILFVDLMKSCLNMPSRCFICPCSLEFATCTNYFVSILFGLCVVRSRILKVKKKNGNRTRVNNLISFNFDFSL